MIPMHNLRLIGFLVLWLAGCTGSDKQQQNGTADRDGAAESKANRKVIVFFGNSLTAGYGLELSEAYPALIQAKIDSLRLNYEVINAGVSGETSASGNSRIDWVLESPIDVFVLELGGNDGLRGLELRETYKNLQSIISKVKNKYPDAVIILAGMQVPPNMGKQYSEAFAAMYPQLAREMGVRLIPFLLEGVGGERHLNLSDGIHPTAEGQQIVAENVWQVLKDVL